MKSLKDTMSPQFTRNIENFTCNNCGMEVKGNGYTNHCPNCLWSRHVDINPGDRMAECGGMMKPVGIEKGKDGFDIIHSCIKCGKRIRNKTSPNDNFDAIVKLSQHPA